MTDRGERALGEARPRPERQGAEAPSSPWGHRYPLIAVALLVLLAYSDAFTGRFVFDDLQHVRDELRLRDLGRVLSWDGYLFFRHRFVGYLTFAVNYALGELDVTGYHLFNVAIHAVNAALVYWLVLLAFRTPRLRGSALAGGAQAVAFFAAALFATHPLQTQAVTYVVQRFTSLATLFYVLAVVLFLAWRLRRADGARAAWPGWLLYAGVLAALLLATKTKEIAFTAPLALALCELTFFEPLPWRRRLFLAPLVATLAIIPLTVVTEVAPRFGAVAGATRVQTAVSRLDYLLTQAPVVARYLGLLAWPVGQNVDHDVRVAHAVTEPRVLAALLLLATLAVVAGVLYRATSPRRARPLDPGARLVAFGVAWFFLALAVESSLIPIADVMVEHRVYLPSVGAFIAAGALLALAARRIRPVAAPRVVAVTAVVLAVVLMGATFQRNLVWKGEIALWSDAATKSPLKARAHMNLGTALVAAGRTAEGAAELRRAAELEPGSPYARAQLGAALIALGRPAEAEPELREAIRLQPRDPEALFNLAMLVRQSGRPDEAKPLFRRFLEVAPPELSRARRLAERAAR